MPTPPMMAGEGMSEPTDSESSERTSVFIPKEALGERECKPGEKLTLTVRDVDADSGEVEATVDGYSEERPSSSSDTAGAIDSMPDE